MKIEPISLLLVEDDEADILDFRRSMRQFRLPNPLYVARDGIEALDMLRGRPAGGGPLVPYPRIVLLDLHMPRLDGLGFLKLVRADLALRSTTIIAITGDTDERNRAAALDLNVASYFVKPVNFELLAEMISCLDQTWRGAGSRPKPPISQPQRVS